MSSVQNKGYKILDNSSFLDLDQFYPEYYHEAIKLNVTDEWLSKEMYMNKLSFCLPRVLILPRGSTINTKSWLIQDYTLNGITIKSYQTKINAGVSTIFLLHKNLIFSHKQHTTGVSNSSFLRHSVNKQSDDKKNWFESKQKSKQNPPKGIRKKKKKRKEKYRAIPSLLAARLKQQSGHGVPNRLICADHTNVRHD